MVRRTVSLSLLLGLALGATSGQGAAEDFTTNAIVRMVDETVISAEMSGRINKLPFDEGDYFAAGARLVEFNCDILDAEKAVFTAAVHGAEAQLMNAKRLDRLGAAGSLDLALAQAALEEAQANLGVAGAKLRRCAIVAPFKGVVLFRDVKPHESVEVMKPLLRIGRPGVLRVEIIVPTSWLDWMARGKTFEFRSHKSVAAYNGRVDRIGAAVDAASQTLIVEGVLTSDAPLLRSGMGGLVRFVSKAANE